MEGGSNSFKSGAKTATELETLQKQFEEKRWRLEELRKQKEEMQSVLNKKRKEVPEKQLIEFRNLSEKYKSLRDEYNALLFQKSQETQK